MRIVVRYVSSDGFTYCCENIVPIIYESLEAAILDFEEALNFPDQYGEFQFGGHTFYRPDFVIDDVLYMPAFMTVDEWFAEVE